METNQSNVVIVGHWEIGYMAPIMESRHWGMILRDFDVHEWWMCPVSGIFNEDHKYMNLHEERHYDDILAKIDPKLTRIFLEPRTTRQPETTWLHDFQHPKDCVYIFGSAHYNPTIAHKREGDKVVSIKTVHDKGVPWANQCVAIVLYDRMTKSWQ